MGNETQPFVESGNSCVYVASNSTRFGDTCHVDGGVEYHTSNKKPGQVDARFTGRLGTVPDAATGCTLTVSSSRCNLEATLWRSVRTPSTGALAVVKAEEALVSTPLECSPRFRRGSFVEIPPPKAVKKAKAVSALPPPPPPLRCEGIRASGSTTSERIHAMCRRLVGKNLMFGGPSFRTSF